MQSEEADRTAIVFVHFGGACPPYLILNLEGTRRRFPNRDVYLVRDRVDPTIGGYENLNVIEVIGHSFWPTLSGDPRFWDNWWTKTLYRLLALQEAHGIIGDRPILHIESDVFLSKTFPFQALKKNGKLAWPGHGHASDIASVLFSPTLRETDYLVEHLIALTTQNSNLTDMTALFQIRRNNPQRVTSLYQGLDANSLVTKFSGVFDGANFGSYIFGSDPAAKWGLYVRTNRWSDDGRMLRGFRFFVSGGEAFFERQGGEKTSIHNLHVHSKSKRFFKSQTRSGSIFEITPSISWGFSPRGLAKWLAWKPGLLLDSILTPKKWAELFRRIFK